MCPVLRSVLEMWSRTFTSSGLKLSSEKLKHELNAEDDDQLVLLWGGGGGTEAGS